MQKPSWSLAHAKALGEAAQPGEVAAGVVGAAGEHQARVGRGGGAQRGEHPDQLLLALVGGETADEEHHRRPRRPGRAGGEPAEVDRRRHHRVAPGPGGERRLEVVRGVADHQVGEGRQPPQLALAPLQPVDDPRAGAAVEVRRRDVVIDEHPRPLEALDHARQRRPDGEVVEQRAAIPGTPRQLVGGTRLARHPPVDEVGEDLRAEAEPAEHRAHLQDRAADGVAVGEDREQLVDPGRRAQPAISRTAASSRPSTAGQE
jgi:hypothetical protein